MEYYSTDFGYCSNSNCPRRQFCELYLQFVHSDKQQNKQVIRNPLNRCFVKHKKGKRIGMVRGLDIMYEEL